MANLLLLGAGYGGIHTAIGLEKAGQPFTILNKHDYHTFTTLLHEPAGGRNEFDHYAVALGEVLRSERSQLQQATVTRIDPTAQVVETTAGRYDYDVLVVALGNAPEYFGIPGLAEHALVLRSLESARQIRAQIEQSFADWHKDRDPAKLRIVVGGAGLTGVELCGELAEWMPELCNHYGVPLADVELINLEAAPTILPMLDPQLQQTAAEVLRAKGVRLRTSTAIVQVAAGRVELKGGETIHAQTIIWTGGVRANPLLAAAGFEVDARGRAKVRDTLQAVDHDNVFIIGDSACFIEADGKPLPPTGQAASQMGDHAARNVVRYLQGQPLLPFHFTNMGTLASLGSELGVGTVKGVKTKGVPANLMKEASKLKYLFSLGGLRMVHLKRGQLQRKS